MRNGLRTHIAALFGIVLLVGACSAGSATSPSGAGGTLTITSPTSGSVVYTPLIEVTGTAPDGAEITRDIPAAADDHTTAAADGWSMSVKLKEGVNELAFRIGDDDSTTQMIVVTYRTSADASPSASVVAIATTSPSPTTTPPPTAQPTPEATPEPTPEPTPDPTLDPQTYVTLNARTWAKVVKSPDDYLYEGYQLWGCISQFDAATGAGTFRAQASFQKEDYWYTDGDNALFSGDEDQLADFVEDDMVFMKVVSLGSFTYDTQIGGSTTAPAFYIDQIKRKGSC